MVHIQSLSVGRGARDFGLALVLAAGTVGSYSALASDVVAFADPATTIWIGGSEAEARRVMLTVPVAGANRTFDAALSVSAHGGEVVWASAQGLRLDAMLTPAQARAVLLTGDVVSMELWSPPEVDGPLERSASGAIVLENELGLTGAGVVGGLTDRGVFVDHQEFEGRLPFFQTDNTNALSHGTATFGILFASGSGDTDARGMLPDSVGVFASYDLFNDRDAIVEELFSPSVRGVFQSNSWGGARTRAYATASAEMDDIIFRRDVLIVQSQSNTGDQDSRPEAWAKNVVSVGGINAWGTADLSDDTWSGGASTGPSLDGRVKPDLVHFNGGVLTTDDAGTDAYLTFGGTSASAPLVAGVFGLFYELWATGELGNAVGGGDVWSERPSSALARAMLINTAKPYPFESSADDFGRFRQGWGLPDVSALWDTRDALAWWDKPGSLEAGESSVFRVEAVGGRDLRVSLVYDDAPASPFDRYVTRNDLDLMVESPSGVVYRGNSGLFDGVWSVPGGRGDPANTVENVFVERAEAGSWIVRVTANGVSVDGDVSTPMLDQSFALVATGARVDASSSPAMYLAGDVPERLDAPWVLRVGVDSAGGDEVDSLRVVTRRAGSLAAETVVNTTVGGMFVGSGPVVACGGVNDVRIEALSGDSVVASWPRGGGFAPIESAVSVVAFEDDFETPGGWTVSGDALRGGWEWAVPSGGGLRNDPVGDVLWDSDPVGGAWVTQDGPGLRDVAGGPTFVESPSIDLSGLPAPTLTYAAWLACDDAGLSMQVGVAAMTEDVMVVSASADGGATWAEVDRVRSTFRWSERSVSLAAFADEADVRLRFEVSDLDDNSLTEAGIDAVRVTSLACLPCVADLDGNAVTDLSDIDSFIGLFLDGARVVDFDRSGLVDLGDVDTFVVSTLDGCGG